MADIAAADVAVTILRRSTEGRTKRNLCRLVFGDGALTYPTGGVPMPAKGAFGLVYNLDYLILVDTMCSAGIVWKWDYTNKKLRGWIQGLQLSAAGAGVIDDYPINNAVDTLASAALSIGLVGGAAGVKHLGQLKELINTQAPAAQTIIAEAVGG